MASYADIIIESLENTGLKHIFGVPGDYILSFMGRLTQSKKITLINNADEVGAGFAADGYARANGLGCVAVTYSVGALKLCNAIAGAYAERSPVVVISGSPGVSERNNDFLLHHMVSGYDCQRQVFKNITCAQAILDNPATAAYMIDEAFAALRHYKQPIYIELPRDLVSKPVSHDIYTTGTPKIPQTDMHNLEDALKEVVNWFENSKNPVILAGVEIARYGLGKELINFIEKHNIPIASTLLSKSVIQEGHPLYIGVYAGSNSSQQRVIEMVENSDCLLVFGEVITEATVGYRASKAFQKRDMVTCTISGLKVKNHNYPNVSFSDFCSILFKSSLKGKDTPECLVENIHNRKWSDKFTPRDTKLTTYRLFDKLNCILHSKFEDLVFVADVGDAMLGASDLLEMPKRNTFYAPAFYLSMGFAIPASLGLMLANPKLRPIVVVGDGSFQMSCSEISTMIRYKLNPIIVVLNNGGYTTERFILEGSFNNILDWKYDKFTEVLGSGKGIKVEKETELEAAFDVAFGNKEVTVINCILDSKDISPALKRITDSLAKKVR